MYRTDEKGGSMFRIGDLVVHPMHGAGVIDDIVQEKIGGVIKEYYVFKMPTGGLVLKIPTENSQVIGIRSIISQEAAEKLLHDIPDLTVDTDRLRPIAGLMPDPTALPEGCKFHPRCPHCTERCTKEIPELKDTGDGHQVACFLYD